MPKRNFISRSGFWLTIFLVIAVLLFVVDRQSDIPGDAYAEIHSTEIIEQLRFLYEEVDKGYERIGHTLEGDPDHADLLSAMKNEYGISWLIYENGSLRYWSDNVVVIPKNLSGLEFSSGNELLKIKTG
jgi:hypothetical protein